MWLALISVISRNFDKQLIASFCWFLHGNPYYIENMRSPSLLWLCNYSCNHT
ncbi:hypothetical protein Hanom_Chr03g00263741 [Helianthus anomalus]